jgi:tetratricopeptide (TPR) repeat protein
MKSVFVIFLISAVISFSAKSQNAVIKEVERSMTTYPFSDPDPVARMGRIYPYFRFDGFTSHPVTWKWKMVELENDYIRLAVIPDMGGKVWEAYEKSENFPFIFSGHSIKFRDVALRGAWTSDGLEFNFGDIGHATTTSTPVDYYTRTNPDGSVSCFIGATEWASRTTWRVEIKLDPDKAYFTTRSWWYNNTPVEQEMYHWINAGFRAPGNLEFIFPGTHYIGHLGEFDTWPLDSLGRKISFYEHNNFGSMKSFHVLGIPTNFYGGYWHDYDMGFGHYTPYYEKLGKKAWSWGLSGEGLMWEKLLTDTDGPNVELQSGRLFNQASYGSEFTPFKHVGFAPYTADTWTDHWFPVKHTRGLTNASPRGALNLRIEDGWLKIDWMSLEQQSDTLKVLASGSPVISRHLVLKPMENFRDSVKWNDNMGKVEVRLGDDVLTDDPARPLSRPLKSPANFDWTSEYGLLVRGTDLGRQKNYSKAEEYLMKALEKNPNLVPALTQMAQIRYRQGLYENARQFAGQALAVNTYDPEANYFWGLSSDRLGQESDALDGFSVATLSPSYRRAAWLRIAYLNMKKADWKGAEILIDKCIQNFPPDENSWIVKAVIDRKLGENDNALKIINEQLTFDPLNHQARFEKYLNTNDEADRDEFVNLISQELSHETFIEMAIQYYEWNMDEEALLMLNLAPEHPMVEIWQAWLLNKYGYEEEAIDKLAQAANASPELVFPFRPEMIELFSWANQVMHDWKWLYYEALICWQNNQIGIARSLFSTCDKEPDFAPFYLAKAKLFRDDPGIVKEAVEDAYWLDPGSWRTGIEMAKLQVNENLLNDALETARKNYKNHKDNCVVALHLANILRLNNRYEETLKTLEHLVMLPAESDKWSGDIDSHSLFRETNILCALNQMKSGKWKRALTYLADAETWPEHLGWGEPYFPDNRLTQFLSAYCYNKLNDRVNYDKSFTYLSNYSNPDGRTGSLENQLSAMVKAGSRDFKMITETITGGLSKNREIDILKTFLTIL